MALQIFETNSVGAGIRADLTTLDDAFVAQGVTVGSTNTATITGTGSGHNVNVAGNVYGFGDGITLGNDPALDMNQRVVIGTGGFVGSAGSDAIEIQGQISEVVNSGTISGIWGIYIGGIGAGQSSITNYGMITGDSDAILRTSNSTDTLLVTNFGQIIAGGIGNGKYALNAGLCNAIEIVRNRGSIAGDINFGLGNDIYDGRGGTIEGTVFGEGGNDIFYAGASAETFDGDTEIDTLDSRTSTGVTAALDNSLGGTGWALGDTYSNIENVYGSLSGVDFLRGSNQNNVLLGFGGNDRLEGLAGNDTLRGGAGTDTLLGGTNNDVFQYLSAAEGGDIILDYGNVAGNDDQIRVSAAGFGGGLVAGALNPLFFQSRADNLAQDANDRFIFRTTDQTLWFDVNGNAAGGLTMIADIQAGAVLTAADIFMF